MKQALCFFCPSTLLALQHGSIVPHEWLAATARSVEYDPAKTTKLANRG